MTHRLEMGELAAAHDADHGAGQLGGLDVATQRLADAAQPRRGQTHALGLGTGKGWCGHGEPHWWWRVAQRIMRDVVRG
jgi:hypothetical protein